MSSATRISADRVRMKRAYERPARADGTRVLVDRLWPRGLKKADAAIDEWMKEIAPSADLRKWFAHDPERWREFQRRYTAEIRNHAGELERLRALAQEGALTLLFSAHDAVHNNAAVLRDVLLGRGRGHQSASGIAGGANVGS